MTTTEMQARMDELEARNASLEKLVSSRVSFKETDRGALSVSVNGSYPDAKYRESWERLAEIMPDILAHIKANPDKYSKDSAKAKAAKK